MIKVEHIYRESNRATHYLAGLGNGLSLGIHVVYINNHALFLHLLYFE
ncbi:hypothetical protein LINGRAHAP2_LOCUS33053 [Linum grandiflorum]